VTLGSCAIYARASELGPFEKGRGASPVRRVLCRGTIAWLHVVQPLARAWGRARGWWHPPGAAPSAPAGSGASGTLADGLALVAGLGHGLRFWSETPVSGDALLDEIVLGVRRRRAVPYVEVDPGWWTERDLSVPVLPLVRLDLRSLVEHHGGGRCLVRVRLRLHAAWRLAAGAALLAGAGWAIAGPGVGPPWIVGLSAAAGLLAMVAQRAGHRAAVLGEAACDAAQHHGMRVLDNGLLRWPTVPGDASRPHVGALQEDGP
jgi:hypothetical protein